MRAAYQPPLRLVRSDDCPSACAAHRRLASTKPSNESGFTQLARVTRQYFSEFQVRASYSLKVICRTQLFSCSTVAQLPKRTRPLGCLCTRQPKWPVSGDLNPWLTMMCQSSGPLEGPQDFAQKTCPLAQSFGCVDVLAARQLRRHQSVSRNCVAFILGS